MLRPVLFSLLALFPFVACECEEPLSRVAPMIAIGDPFDPTASACRTEQVRDCSLDFGAVPVGRAKVVSFLVKNPSPVDLHIHSMIFEAGSDPAFSFEGAPPTVVTSASGAAGALVSIKFVPTVASSARARLIIDSDAENLLPDELVIIELVAGGEDQGAPNLVVSPAACTFGDVGVGATGYCDLSLENTGQRELTINGVDFSADTPFPAVFGPGATPGVPASFPIPTRVQAGTAVSLRLYARPTTADLFEGVFIVSSDDPDAPVTEVPLSVQGADIPTAVARVKSVNDVNNNSPNPAVTPLDDVVLSADQSTAARAAGSITQWQWEIVQKPVESSVRLSTPTAEETGFRFDSAAGVVNGLDVAGTFVVRLTVTDDLGAISLNDARVTLNAVPDEGLHIQLTWDVGGSTDIDLHLARNGTDWCSDDDCSYNNACATSGGLDWGSPAEDPHLDIDDTAGFGPENINIDEPADGDYTIGVVYFEGSRRTTATVKVFIGGALSYEGFSVLNVTGDLWVPARIEMNGGVATIVELNHTDIGVGGAFEPHSCMAL